MFMHLKHNSTRFSCTKQLYWKSLLHQNALGWVGLSAHFITCSGLGWFSHLMGWVVYRVGQKTQHKIYPFTTLCYRSRHETESLGLFLDTRAGPISRTTGDKLGPTHRKSKRKRLHRGWIHKRSQRRQRTDLHRLCELHICLSCQTQHRRPYRFRCRPYNGEFIATAGHSRCCRAANNDKSEHAQACPSKSSIFSAGDSGRFQTSPRLV